MVILIGLRMNDVRMIDPGLADEPDIIFHWFPLGLVGCAVVRNRGRLVGETNGYAIRSIRPRAAPPLGQAPTRLRIIFNPCARAAHA